MTDSIIRLYGENWGTTSIEVEISSANGTYKLPDDSILREKRIIGLFMPSNEDGTAVSPSGRDLVSDAAARSSYINIKQNNDEVLMDHPLSDFLQTTGDRSVRLLNMCNINPQKCEIVVGDTSLITIGESVLLQFIYQK